MRVSSSIPIEGSDPSNGEPTVAIEPPTELARTDEVDIEPEADVELEADVDANDAADDEADGSGKPVRTKVTSTTPLDLEASESVPPIGKSSPKANPSKVSSDKSSSQSAPSSGGGRRLWWWAAAVIGLVVLPLAALLIFYAVDTGDDRVARGVRLDGEDLSLLAAGEIRPFVQARADRFAEDELEFVTPQGSVMLTAADIGLELNVDKTVSDVENARTARGGLGRFTSWIGSFSGSGNVDFTLDRPDDAALRAALDGLGSDLEFAPTEPVLNATASGYELDAAVAGQEIKSEGLAGSLPTSLARVNQPIEIAAELTLLPTEIPGGTAEQATTELNALTSDSLTIRALGESQTAHPGTLRRWLNAELTPDGYDVSFDRDAVMKFVDSRFVGLDRPGQEATFNVVDDVPEIIAPSFEGIRCCADGSPDLVLDALQAGESFVRLETTPNPAQRDLAWAESMGVVELVGEFTSRHACCQGRVTNIQRIADLTRGAFIEPGETFSLNDHVGKRTTEKGFVGGGVIYNGEFTEDIGGGISQFVTTMFNAAFFGGLDFGEYQSHSKYISRYPYGREATISWRRPEFEIINTTPHGVLVWTEYTSNSITVKLYSTVYATGEQTGQRTYTHGLCKDVTTERTRTYVDGRVEIDTVIANYREGTSGRC